MLRPPYPARARIRRYRRFTLNRQLTDTRPFALRNLVMTLSLPHPTWLQFARYLLGITVVSAGATLGIQSGVGGAPYDALLATITDHTPVPFWATAWLLQGVWIMAILRMGGRFGVGTLLHSLSFGPIMSVALGVVPVADSTLESVLYVAGAVFSIAVGLSLYLGAGFVAGMVDTLFEVTAARKGWRPALIRTSFDAACVGVAWAGSGPVGVGTVVIALGVGPLLGLMDSGLLRPASWRGIPIGGRRPDPVTLDLVDTTEYRVFSLSPR